MREHGSRIRAGASSLRSAFAGAPAGGFGNRIWPWTMSRSPVFALASGVALTFLVAIPASAEGQAPAGRFDTVVVDAGHGGGDHGARGPAGLLEKDVVLDVARRLASRLRATGLEVILTRGDDRFVPLEERTRLANEAGADLFVSIHANASRHRGVSGVETFFASPDATDEAARELANTENLAFGASAAKVASGDPLLAILGDMLANEHLTASQEFARFVQGEMATAQAARSRGVKQAPFVVLMGVRMPSVLVEIGFLTNRADERSLGTVDARDRLADGLADAVALFRERQDARLGLANAGGR